MDLTKVIEQLIDKVITQKLEEKIPEIIRALGVDKSEDDFNLVDALEIAQMLGRDTSTPRKARAARLYIYNLARSGHIPSVRISEKRIMFNPVAVRRRLNREAA